MPNHLVDFFVVGAPKSGTTSLYQCLKMHPDIYLPDKKELHFFSYGDLTSRVAGPGDRYILDDCVSNVGQYNAYYLAQQGERLSGDISPSYLASDGAAAGIHAYNPNAKVIIILREHVQKAFSQYMHLRASGRERLSFEEALKKENARSSAGYADFWLYTQSTEYASDIKRYLDLFGTQNMLVLFTSELRDDPSLVANRIFKFLNLEELGWLPDTERHNLSGEARSKLLARLFLSPNWFTAILRRLIPASIGGPVRAKLRRLNTGEKLPLAPEVAAVLTDKFAQDKLAVEGLLKRKVNWL